MAPADRFARRGCSARSRPACLLRIVERADRAHASCDRRSICASRKWQSVAHDTVCASIEPIRRRAPRPCRRRRSRSDRCRRRPRVLEVVLVTGEHHPHAGALEQRQQPLHAARVVMLRPGAVAADGARTGCATSDAAPSAGNDCSTNSQCFGNSNSRLPLEETLPSTCRCRRTRCRSRSGTDRTTPGRTTRGPRLLREPMRSRR